MTTDKIKDGEVKAEDVADGTITSTDIAPGTIPSDGGFSLQVTERSSNTHTWADGEVKSVDIGDGEVTTQDLANGAVTQEKIASGAIMPNVHEVVGDGVLLRPGQNGFAVARCPDGEFAVGGGYGVYPGFELTHTGPRESDDNPLGDIPHQWYIQGADRRLLGEPLFIVAHVICMGPMP